jgi:hypothetical protein
MNKLLLLFIVVIISQIFADEANFRMKDASGKNFKDAMNGLRPPVQSPFVSEKSSVSSKLKALEDVLSTKAPKKIVPSPDSDNGPYDTSKFGPEMAELSKRITG